MQHRFTAVPENCPFFASSLLLIHNYNQSCDAIRAANTSGRFILNFTLVLVPFHQVGCSKYHNIRLKITAFFLEAVN